MRFLVLIFIVMTLVACSASKQMPVVIMDKPRVQTHTVESGETLQGIALQYDLDYQDIAYWNDIDKPYRIYPGQSLVLKGIQQISRSWFWPTQGKVICHFGETPCRRGIYIEGIQGQLVVASSAGKVVYSGHGIKGYEGLVILEHEQGYLSAYGYNQELLVHENEQVMRGQKIGVMGVAWEGKPLLYFEVRRHGRATDPLRLLPNKK